MLIDDAMIMHSKSEILDTASSTIAVEIQQRYPAMIKVSSVTRLVIGGHPCAAPDDFIDGSWPDPAGSPLSPFAVRTERNEAQAGNRIGA